VKIFLKITKKFTENKSASAFNTLLEGFCSGKLLVLPAFTCKNGKKNYGLADSFHATDLLPQLYWDLSSVKTRVNLMKSLLNDPELILMDEPTRLLIRI